MKNISSYSPKMFCESLSYYYEAECSRKNSIPTTCAKFPMMEPVERRRKDEKSCVVVMLSVYIIADLV